MSEEYRVEELSVKATRFVLPIGIVIDELTISHDDTVFVPSVPLKLERPATVFARISSRSLTEFLEAMSPGGLSNFEVRAEEAQLVVSATARVVVPIRAHAVCTLQATTEKTIAILLQSVEPSAGRTIVERQLAQINPVVDLAKLPYDIAITCVRIVEGFVEIEGTVTP